MTNFESIKQGTHKGFNELLETSGADTIAEMLSEISCERCICKTYCDDCVCGSCQQVIEDWLMEDYFEAVV